MIFLKIMLYICRLNRHNMKIQTIKEYAEEHGISERTVCRRINNKQLPSYLNIKNLEGRGYVLWSDQCKICEITELAITEFNSLIKTVQKDTAEQRQFKRELATQLGVKYGIKQSKIFKILVL